MDVALRKPIAMKQISMYFFGVSLLSFALLSCSKEAHNDFKQQAATPQVIEATVPAGQTYSLNLGTGTAATILSQAQHFQVSEIATARDGNVVYKYTAGKGYAGGDEVTLQQTIKYTSQGGGCSQNHSNGTTTTTVQTTVIKFNVAN